MYAILNAINLLFRNESRKRINSSICLITQKFRNPLFLIFSRFIDLCNALNRNDY